MFPDIEPDQMIESCSLDVSDRGAATNLKVAGLMNVTKQRLEQIENGAVRKMGIALRRHGIDGSE